AGWMDGRSPGTLPALPRLLAIRRHDLRRPAGQRLSRTCRAVQLCARCHSYAAGDPARAQPAAARSTVRRQYARSTLIDDGRTARHGVQLLRRTGGAAVAQLMARKRTLVLVRHLLPRRKLRGILLASSRLLRLTSAAC